MKKGFTLIMSAMLIFPAALWTLSWYLSARKQASTFCNNHFSLFHSEAICQEPSIALYLSILICIVSIFILRAGARAIRLHSTGK